MKEPIKRTVIVETLLARAWTIWVRRYNRGLRRGHVLQFSTVVRDLLRQKHQKPTDDVVQQYVQAARNVYIQYQNAFWFQDIA